MRVSLKQRAILVLVWLHVGKCVTANPYFTGIKTEIIKGNNVASSYKTLNGYSKFRCLSMCLKQAAYGVCKAAGYDTLTQTCFLSSDVVVKEGDSNSVAFVLIYKGNKYSSIFYQIGIRNGITISIFFQVFKVFVEEATN